MNAPIDPARLDVPHSIQSEQTILGGLMFDARAFDRIADVIRETDFYAADHRLIYRAISGLFERGQAIDAITVYEALGRPSNGEAGDLPYLIELTNTTPGIANIRRHAEIVRTRAQLRELSAAGADLQRAVQEPLADVEAVVATTEAALMAATDREEGQSVTIAEAIDGLMAYLEERDERGANDLRTGIDKLDLMLGGLALGALVVIGARPAMGKTSLGCTIADHLVMAGRSVYLHSLEMTTSEITMKMLALRSGISTTEIRSANRGRDVYRRVVEQRLKAEGQRLFIDDKPAVTVGYLRAKARRLKRQHGLDLILVDYLGLMRGAGDNRTQEIGSISRGLKALAKELSVPVIALAQLNREVHGRADQRPVLSDLRDSGEIEQDADVVVMLHREEQISGADARWRGLGELLIRKNRSGRTGECLVSFHAETGKFADTDKPSPRSTATASTSRRGGLS